MAAYCFVCDAPVDGDACSNCGRPPTWVDDEPGYRQAWTGRISSVPRWVWPLVMLLVAAGAFSLMRAGFHLLG